MNKDFRVLVTLPTHPKTKKLMRQLGDRAFYNLIRLWAWVAQNKPEGVMANMDKDDIEIACDWQGQEGLFIDTLIELKLVDCNDGVCEIHDWEDNNGFAFSAAQRSEKAKKAAKARWGSKDANDAKSCLGHCSEDAQADLSNAPSPSPSPSPTIRNKIFTTPSENQVVSYFVENGYSAESGKTAFKYYAEGDPPWHDSNGKKVKSWKQKMRGVWFRPENQAKKPEKFGVHRSLLL